MRNHTKKALVLSVLSLVLCVSMLVGTTFAWFTDSVTTGVNTIQSGTLDVDMVKADGSAIGDKLYFRNAQDSSDILWEPGAMFALDSFKIVNKGNLALQYALYINGLSGDAKLLEAIDFYVTIGDVAYANVLANGTALNLFNATNVKLLPNTSSEKITLWGKMKEEAGNEYQGLFIDGISITVLATQVTEENDSFDNQYDKNAVYADHYVYDTEDLTAAIAAAKAGDIIALYAGDYQLPMNDTWWKATDLPANVTLFGAEDGVKVTPVSNGSTEVGEQGRIQAEGYTFRNITFTNTVSPDGYGTFVDCVFDGYNGLRQGAYKGDTKFVNCEFNNADGWAFHTEYLYAADVTFENCKFSGLVEFTDTIDEANNVYFNECAFLGSNRTSSGKIFYAWKNNAVLTDCAGYEAALFAGCKAEGTPQTYVGNSAELKNALDSGKKDILAIGGEFTDKVNLGSTSNATFVDCTFSGNNAWGYANDVVYKGCTFESASDTAAMHFDRLYGTMIVKDCTFVSGKVQIGTDGSSEAFFENCVFGETTSTSIWAEKGMRFYCPTTFTGCEFNNRVVLAGSNGLSLTFDACTMNGGKPVYYVDNTDGIIRGGNVPVVTIK